MSIATYNIFSEDGLEALFNQIKANREAGEENSAAISDLMDRIDGLGAGVDAEVIKQVVKDWLEENPIDSGVNFTTDTTLTLDPDTGVLSVNTTDTVEEDNTLPITSAAVYSTVGNIEILLRTI